MNRMLGYLKGYERESVLAPLFKMLEATFDLFVPLVMADIVNVGIAAHDLHYILVRCGLLLLLAFIGLTCSLTAQYFSAKAAVGYSTALRHALFAHIQSLSFSEMDTLGTSTLITRMTSDVNQVQSGLNLFLRLFLRSPFVVLGAMVMAFTVNARAAMIFVVTIPLLSVVVFGVMVITRPLYKTVQTRLDRVLGLTRENLMACGDGLNDRSMIDFAGVGVAMQNAEDTVKEVADYVTAADNNHDGVAEAIEKFILQ